MKQVCPTPTKKRYATQEAAYARAPRAELVLGYPLYPYQCTGCGWVHLTSNPGNWTPPGATPAPGDVARIAHLNATDFTHLVTNDTKGRITRADRLALRHPDNLTRWRHTLKTLRADITKQLAARAGATHDPHNVDWLNRATGYRNTLNARLTECRTLRNTASTTRHAA